MLEKDRIWVEVATGYNCYNLDSDNLETIAIVVPSLEQLLTKNTYINDTYLDRFRNLNGRSCQYVDILSYFIGLKESDLKFLEILNSNTFYQDKDYGPTFSELKAKADDIANINLRRLAFSIYETAVNHKSYLCNHSNESSFKLHIRASEVLRLGEFFDRFLDTRSLSYALDVTEYNNKKEILALRDCILSIDEIEDKINRVYDKLKRTFKRLDIETDSSKDEETLKFLDDFMYSVAKAHIGEEIKN